MGETPVMKNRQVPRAEWYQFFRAFSRVHQGWLTTLRVLSGGLGAQVEARDLPLEGVVSDESSVGPITISLGGGLSTHIEHRVFDPLQVWVERTEDGAEAAVEIESKDGTKTLLEFSSAALPETVDGVLGPGDR
jgi:hypothetical protein